jgi:phage minor structural protein
VPKEEGSEVPLLPADQNLEPIVVNEYKYYLLDENPQEATAEGYKATSDEYKYSDISNSLLPAYVPIYSDEKVRTINAKQSNYFNIIQSLCEQFGCWAEFIIGHDEEGRITEKSIRFLELLDKENFAGFKKGVNLKDVKRTLDSKAIVTKLIVPDNVNEFAPNGFCSIARAGANPTGENYIYNF